MEPLPAPSAEMAHQPLPRRERRAGQGQQQRAERGTSRRTDSGTVRRRSVRMIRHAQFGGALPCAISTLMLALICPSFRGLLMATIGGATLRPAGLLAARQTAIDLPALAGGADEEDAAARANTLTKRRGTKSMHQPLRAGWTAPVHNTENV